MFVKGEFPEVNNPWPEDSKNAPFDQEFFIIFNVAVGGTNSYFPDGMCDKFWTNDDEHAVNTFYDNKEAWYPSWNYPETHDSAMQIDYVKVYSMDGEPEFLSS
mmetsp:Transcript_36949/g.56591  ORF Transcript_36949/g.56591 Transcript_36949/m.56591 type:complete len:103 (-) Transcript_36949:41-349(-)